MIIQAKPPSSSRLCGGSILAPSCWKRAWTADICFQGHSRGGGLSQGTRFGWHCKWVFFYYNYFYLSIFIPVYIFCIFLLPFCYFVCAVSRCVLLSLSLSPSLCITPFHPLPLAISLVSLSFSFSLSLSPLCVSLLPFSPLLIFLSSLALLPETWKTIKLDSFYNVYSTASLK